MKPSANAAPRARTNVPGALVFRDAHAVRIEMEPLGRSDSILRRRIGSDRRIARSGRKPVDRTENHDQDHRLALDQAAREFDASRRTLERLRAKKVLPEPESAATSGCGARTWGET